MKYEELIDFTQKILEANYLPVYRFELPCEDLDHLDQDCAAIFWAQKILPDFSMICLKN